MAFLLALALVVLGVRGVAGALEADGVSAAPEPMPSPMPTAEAERTEPATVATNVPATSPATGSAPGPDTGPATVPATGPGTYVGASDGTASASSKGTLKRFDVQVEKGLEVDAGAAAGFIAEVLNDERSWRGTGRWRFELVPVGEPVELHAYLVTPGTTDKLCAPLKTGGEVSCQIGSRVVLNAKRWALGVAYYGDDLVDYRRYLVNHSSATRSATGTSGAPGPDGRRR